MERLRASDQACSIAGVVVLLVLIAARWICGGGLDGHLVNIDRASRPEIPFALDVNRASTAEWTLLPGIGETLARRIVAWRETNGPFRFHDELLDVPGIGPKTLTNMKPLMLPCDP